MNCQANTIAVAIALIASVSLAAAAGAQTEAAGTAAAPKQTLYLHGFRSPSIGLEYRRGNIGLHSGLYMTNLTQGETTRFQKSGLTAYLPPLDVSRKGKSEAFLSVAYVHGLNRDYRDKNGFFIEPGLRYTLGSRLEARLGAGVLVVSGRRTKINPTPGISWNIPL